MTKRKETQVKTDFDGKKIKDGEVIGLIDIYHVLCDIRDLLSGQNVSDGKETKKTRKASKEEKEQTKKRLVDGMPYKKEDLEKMKGTHVRMLASALGIKSFGVSPADLRKEIIKFQENPKDEGPKKKESTTGKSTNNNTTKAKTKARKKSTTKKSETQRTKKKG